MTGNIRLDVAELERAIANLLVTYPELAEDEQLRADMFEGETNLSDVLAALVDHEREDRTMVDAIAAREKDLAARKERYKHRQDAWRQLIQHVMEKADQRKFTLPEATLSIGFRKGTPVVTDLAALPDECTKVERKPVMDIIKAWVEAGNVPEGVAMGNGKTSLTIRSR